MKIVYSWSCALLVSVFSLPSCSDPSKKSADKADNAFDLEAITFTEGLPALYATHIVNENGVRYDSARDGQLTDSLLQYRISNTITDAMKLSVPQKDFG